MSIFDIFRPKAVIPKTKPEGNKPKMAEPEEKPVYLQAAEFVEQMLQKMNCQFHKAEQDYFVRYNFDYQGGHFVADAAKEGAQVQIHFPRFFATNPDYLNLVRELCNDMSSTYRFAKFVYGYAEEENSVVAHLVTTVSVPQTVEGDKGFFRRMVESHFPLAHEFSSRFEEWRKKNRKIEQDTDPELMRIKDKRLQYLLAEHELNRQDFSTDLPTRADASHDLTLGNLVEEFYGAEHPAASFQELRVITDTLQVVRGAEQVKAYSLLAPLLEGEGEQVKLKADEAVFLLRGENETFVVQVMAKVEAEKALYFQVNVMVPGLQSKVWPNAEDMKLPSYSFLVAYDKVSQENHEAEFRYMWEDARAKAAEGKTDELTDEQALICLREDATLAGHIYWGVKYFNDARYWEALNHLLPAYKELGKDFHKKDEMVRRTMFEVCLMVGVCYNRLHLYPQGCFYLGVGYNLERPIESGEFANGLIESKDFRAEYVVESILQRLPKEGEDDDSEAEDEEKNSYSIAKLRNSLRRKKALLLIGQGRLNEARKLLEKMLNEPANSDFAMKELAKLQKRKDTAQEDEEETEE